MRILVAPQELKGTLTGAEAADAIARGLGAGLQGAELDVFPIADGGPGTVDAFARATGAELVEVAVEDSIGRPVLATYAVLGERAVIEMASASGLWRIFAPDREPLRASTLGTGQVIAAAVERGCKELWIGLGGSATTDGGTGALGMLGARFLDADGNPVTPGGGGLISLARVKADRVPGRLKGAQVIALSDVRAPLLGPNGAAAVFGPQKGATPEEVELLEKGLQRLHELVVQLTGKDLASEPGAGAAGGMGYGLLALAGASMRDGFAALAELSGLEERIRRADLVVTAEGRFDAQTGMGKGPAALAAMAAAAGKPVVIVSGSIAAGAPVERFALAETICPLGAQKSALPSSAEAGVMLEAAARRIAPRFPELRASKQD